MERDRLPTPVFLGFPCGSTGKESVCNAGDLGSIPGLGRSPGEGKGYPLQCSGLESSMNCIVHGVAMSPYTTERLSLSLFEFGGIDSIRLFPHARNSPELSNGASALQLVRPYPAILSLTFFSLSFWITS